MNDPDDPGGATNWGVTIGTMRRLGVDVDGDGDVDIQDVKLLSLDAACKIFKTHYYKRPKIDQLPAPLQASVYDMQVNAGRNAIKILQRLLGEFGEPVSVDGALGPQSIAAVHKVHETAEAYLVDAYAIGRRNYYLRIADKRARSRKYCRTRAGGKGGWIKRAEAFMGPQYRMTDAQFKERTSAWG